MQTVGGAVTPGNGSVARKVDGMRAAASKPALGWDPTSRTVDLSDGPARAHQRPSRHCDNTDDPGVGAGRIVLADKGIGSPAAL